MIRMRVVGDKAVRKKLLTAGPKVITAVDKAVQKGALMIEAQAVRNAPVDTGRLRKGIRASRIGPMAYQVGVSRDEVPYAEVVEFGSSSHSIESPVFLRGKIRDWRYIKSHPGTSPQPFLRPAFDSEKNKVKAMIEAAIQTALKT